MNSVGIIVAQPRTSANTHDASGGIWLIRTNRRCITAVAAHGAYDTVGISGAVRASGTRIVAPPDQ